MGFLCRASVMRNLLFAGLLISSLLVPHVGMGAEDIVFSESSLHVRTLAASCAACHGTNGNTAGNNSATDTLSLAGLESTHITQRLIDFKTGARSSTVMHHHAKGLTTDEIKQLADYFSHQKLVKHLPPKSQTLKESSYD